MGNFVSSAGSTTPDDLTVQLSTGGFMELHPNSLRFLVDVGIGAIRAYNATISGKGAIFEYFSDSGGLLNLIDTTGGVGNTNATYSSNTYQGIFYEALYNNNAFAGAATPTQREGVKITVGGEAIHLLSVRKTATSGATRCEVYAADKSTLLGTANFSGQTATFSGSGIALSASTVYYIMPDASGAAYAEKFINAGAGQAGIFLTVSKGAFGAVGAFSEDTNVYNIDTITTQSDATYRTIKTDVLNDLNGSWAKINMIAHQDTLPTGASLTFDVDYTGDGNYEQTDLEFNQWHDLGGAQTFSSGKIRVHINAPTDKTQTALLKGFGVLAVS